MKEINFDIRESFGFYFNLIYLNSKRNLEEKLKEYDITYLQFTILIYLYRYNLTTQKEILQYTNGDEASVTRLINRLEHKNYISRIQSETDKRKKKIVLTPSGESLINNAINCAIEVNKELVKDLQEDEAKKLLTLLQKVLGSLDKI